MDACINVWRKDSQNVELVGNRKSYAGPRSDVYVRRESETLSPSDIGHITYPEIGDRVLVCDRTFGFVGNRESCAIGDRKFGLVGNQRSCARRWSDIWIRRKSEIVRSSVIGHLASSEIVCSSMIGHLNISSYPQLNSTIACRNCWAVGSDWKSKAFASVNSCIFHEKDWHIEKTQNFWKAKLEISAITCRKLLRSWKRVKKTFGSINSCILCERYWYFHQQSRS